MTIVPWDVSSSVEEMAQGLEWVHWLLRSLRQRCAGIVVPESDASAEALTNWRVLALTRFPEKMGPVMLETMRVTAQRRYRELRDLELAWEAALTAEEAERSVFAGHCLLKSLAGARHVGGLETVRAAIQRGELAGHIGLVWPVVAVVFFLSEVAMLGEYLRLEYQCAMRAKSEVPLDAEAASLVKSVRLVMKECSLEGYLESEQSEG
jgi:hypothetical protein